MSSHKLYNYEVTPPAEAWERIAQELEGVNEYRNVSQKLQNLQVAAPAFAWDKISGELDDEKYFESVGKKLSSVAVAPPADVWSKIEENLDRALPSSPKVAPVIPLQRRLSKYTAAAAVIGILAIAGYFMVQRSSKDAELISQQFETEKQTVASTETPITSTKPAIKPAPVVDAVSSNTLNIAPVHATKTAVTTSNGNVYSTTVEKNHDADGRYIVLMTEDGNVVRMNKKVSGLADCIAGEDASQECNTKIAAWQKELASMPVLASPDNILGLLELANKEPVVAGL